MTERSAASVTRSAHHFQVGPSALQWANDRLDITIAERAMPFGQRMEGRITVRPRALCQFQAPLDDAAGHWWGPIAPAARVDLALNSPGIAWSGHGYFDSNEGIEPIHRPFTTWDWARCELSDDASAVLYDVRQRNLPDRLLAIRFDRHAEGEPFEAPQRVALPKTRWRIERSIRSESDASVQAKFEDVPFYSRSVVRTVLLGQPAVCMHESLDTDRLIHPIVQRLLPFRMPRVR
jgi:carotenoid 1,2-hydratase